ncbi:CpsD/CapB family tyrosine-protein kinase [Gemmobacter denitrificans]|uniref:CpsD/CapB family tyrosine-protein kinase n=1 Tax=Gemmobacter denitrificans TaxID=3123040 RepID=A0ABU8BSX6_9RHOB
MTSKDEFSERLAQSATQRPAAVSLFRARQVPVRGIVEPGRADGPIEVFSPPQPAPHRPEKVWAALSAVMPDSARMAGNGLFTDAAQNEVTARFDILRTRMLQAMAERGWKKIAVTSPTHGCGKSLVAANLALSVARLPAARAVLVDLELRHPDLARLFDLPAAPLTELLSGEQPVESHLRRIGDNLALALNGEAVPRAAETLMDPASRGTLKAIIDHLDPTVMILDLPPALGSDDVLSVLPEVDAVLLVADGTRTTADDIRACERLFNGVVPFLGVVLNRAEDRTARRYRYGKT